MEESGIDDEHDQWTESIPDEELSERIQAIVHDHATFRNYYFHLYFNDFYNGVENSDRPNCQPWARLREPNIILDRWISLRNKKMNLLSSASNTTIPTSTTPKYGGLGKRNKLFYCRHYDKYTLPSKKLCPDTNECYGYGGPSSSRNHRYSGYIFSNVDSNIDGLLFDDNSKYLSKILTSFLSSKSQS